MATKFDVGDVVKVRSDLEDRYYKECDNTVVTDMLKLKGKYVTIADYYGDNAYRIKEDGYAWCDFWFEDYVRVDKIIIKSETEFTNVLDVFHHNTDKYRWRAGQLPLEGPRWRELEVDDKLELDIEYGKETYYISYRTRELRSDAVPYGEITFDNTDGVYTTIKKGILPVGTQLFRENNPVNVLTDDEIDYIEAEMEILYDTYDYNYNSDVLYDIINVWNDKKGWMINLFKKSSFYKEGKFMLEVPTEFAVGIDHKAVSSFSSWFASSLENFCRANEAKKGAWSYSEIKNILAKYEDVIATLDRCTRYGVEATYNGMKRTEIDEEYYRWWDYKVEIRDNSTEIMGYNIMNPLGKYVEAARYLVSTVFQNISKYVDKDGLLTAKAEETMVHCDIPHNKGTKFMRYISKLAQKLGFDKIKDIKTVSFTDNHGVLHEKEKDMGWNYYRALLGDAISQPKVKKKLFISLNPIDYLTMSFLNGVGSCHTLDKKNLRGCNSNTIYQGMYSSGTISYMLDDVSFVVYEVYDGNNFVEYMGNRSRDITRKTKQRRAMFVLDDNHLFMSRLYPDGRDGGDEDMASNWNNKIKEVISDLLEVDNDWSTSRGRVSTSVLDKAYGATLYPDFYHYDDCFTSELKLKYKKKEKIRYGAEPICICCGSRHTREDNIECSDCRDEHNDDEVECAYCGDWFSPESSYDAVDVGGRYYCCPDCARSDGAEYCDDIEEWTFDYWYSDYEDTHYSDYEEGVDVRCNGTWYTCSRSYAERNLFYDDIEEQWAGEDCSVFEMPNGEQFTSEFFDRDCIVDLDDGTYYPDEQYALDAGYVYIESIDKWVLEEEAIDEGYTLVDGVWKPVESDEESEVA